MIDYGFKPDQTVTVRVGTSGGRTSAYMAYMIKNNQEDVARHLGCKDIKIMYTFANTGLEHDDTLRFMDAVDRNFLDGQVTWVEALITPEKGVGPKPVVVSYETCHRFRDWRKPSHPFVNYIKKQGIPNVKFKSCTRDLKTAALEKYTKRVVDGPHITAIGIRDDETRRVSKTHIDQKIFYPLVDIWPTDKQDVLDFMAQYDWDLAIPEWQGNCVTCYKKSFKKLKQVWIESPEVFEFCAEMERLYPRVGSEFAKHGATRARTFWRGNLSTLQLIETFEITDADPIKYMTEDAGCSESCEMYDTEQMEIDL